MATHTHTHSMQVSIPPEVQSLITKYQDPILGGVGMIAAFVVSFAILYIVGKRLFKSGVREMLQQRDVEPTVVGLAMSVVDIVALVVAIAAASTIAGFGVVMSAFATLSGAVALALGFAAQDIISNFVSGVFIIRDKPFHVGDWIEWNGMSGVVREVQLRTTKIETFDNEVITVPNSELANNPVTNPVSNDQLRIAFQFGIGYDEDIDTAREIILETARNTEGTLSDPEPAVRVTELGDSSVGLTGTVWIDEPTHGEYVRVRSAFVQGVKDRFDEENIAIPYPFTELTGEVAVTGPLHTDIASQRDATVND